jgi:ABC-type phosphate/phosphonate transport system substrate-binding protein
MTVARLPMYALPEMAAANAAFWVAVRSGLEAAEIADLPTMLSPAPNALPETIGADTLFSQMCGYPLKRFYDGQYSLLGTPLYDLPGCRTDATGMPTHCSFVVVAKNAAFTTVGDLRGTRFAMNGRDSNSGMNLPRRLVAPLAEGRPFFAETMITGGHVASMATVASGQADAAAIDCVTFGFCALYRPESVTGLRILAETPSSPAIPFITAAATSAATRAALIRVLAALPPNAALRIVDIAPPRPEAYDAIVALEEEASAMGYSVLA